LERAKSAARGSDVSLAGGVSTIHEYLKAKLVDQLVVAVTPIELGSGERLLTVGEWPEGYELSSITEGEGATFYTLVRSVAP
jgi:dihydrofolate reductase